MQRTKLADRILPTYTVKDGEQMRNKLKEC